MKKLEFKKRKPIINGWLHSPCTLSAEIFGNSNFTSITVDLQHGMLDFNHCRNILQTLSKYNVYPIVRVPSNEIGIINKCLDAGAKGIICPLINTKEDCEKFIESCFYFPKGIRSFGPTLVGINDSKYFLKSNKEITTIIMLETKESVLNLDDILKIKLLDVIYVGPFDLSISHGVSPEEIFKNNKMLKTYKYVLTRVKKEKKIAAIHCTSAEIAIYFLKMGYDFVTLSTDLALLNKSVYNEQDKIKRFLKNSLK